MKILTKIIVFFTIVYLLLQIGRFWGKQENRERGVANAEVYIGYSSEDTFTCELGEPYITVLTVIGREFTGQEVNLYLFKTTATPYVVYVYRDGEWIKEFLQFARPSLSGIMPEWIFSEMLIEAQCNKDFELWLCVSNVPRCYTVKEDGYWCKKQLIDVIWSDPWLSEVE
jgi:hypothetical protein